MDAVSRFGFLSYRAGSRTGDGCIGRSIGRAAQSAGPIGLMNRPLWFVAL
jgi:hypothetical protein